VLAAWTPTLDDTAAHLARTRRDGDVILVVGAGDIDKLVERV
jgi:UDP-N-acetylmuramate-alanine ligase